MLDALDRDAPGLQRRQVEVVGPGRGGPDDLEALGPLDHFAVDLDLERGNVGVEIRDDLEQAAAVDLGQGRDLDPRMGNVGEGVSPEAVVDKEDFFGRCHGIQGPRVWRTYAVSQGGPSDSQRSPVRVTAMKEHEV